MPRASTAITRRALLGTSVGLLAAPALAQPAAARRLRFVPFVDLAVLDPIVTTTYASRNHAYMVFDTLYGTDLAGQAQPQMAEGHVVEDDGKRVRIRLREGLRFHDGAPVRAADCVASIRRWGARDGLGQTILAVTEDLTAEDDRTIRFRLSRPFPLLFFALGKMTPPVCFMMPERLAATDPMRAITEAVGSGPFRFVAEERVAGSRNVYVRNEHYVPRADGPIEGAAGPKRVYFDRVEWVTIPDAGTAAAALQAGEVDWVENVAWDLLPVLSRRADLRAWVQDPSGTMPIMRFNHLYPPFNDPRVRRALLPAIVQSDYLRAVVGDNPGMFQDGVGFFTPGSAMASNVGLEALTGPRSADAARGALAAAGYRGEPVTVLAGQDIPFVKALSEVAADMLRRVGMTVDYAASDWATVAQRRANRNPPAQGGWNLFCTSSSGGAFVNPSVHDILRANGAATWPGWPDIPALEGLRDEWMSATDLAAQQAIARRMQAMAFEELPTCRSACTRRRPRIAAT